MSAIKMKLIYIEKTKKDGGNWFKPMTIVKNGKDEKWVLIKFDANVNDKIFKNENQILKVDASDVEPHFYNFKAWTDEKGKYHEPYLYIKNIKGYEKYVSNKSANNTPVEVNQDLFQMDEDDTLPFDTNQGVDANQE